MANFNNHENVCLHSCASVTSVSIAEIVGSAKRKEVVMARALTCSVLSYYGYGVREISRITNTDVKGVSVYLEGHDNRMADRRYARAFAKSVQFVNSYEEFSDEAMRDKVNVLYEKYLALEGRFEHLKELITNN